MSVNKLSLTNCMCVLLVQLCFPGKLGFSGDDDCDNSSYLAGTLVLARS